MTLFDSLYFAGNILIPSALVLLLSHQAFHKMLRFSPQRSVLLLFPFLAGALFVMLFYQSPLNLWDSTLLFSVPMQLLAYGFLRLLYDLPGSVCLFGYFVIKGFMDNTFLMAKEVQKLFFSQFSSEKELLAFSIAYLLTLLYTLPLMLWFTKKHLAPLIKNTAHRSYWKFLCFIPLGHYLLYTLAISPVYQSPSEIYRNSGVLLPAVWICCNSATGYFLVRMLSRAHQDALDIHNLETEALTLSMQHKFYDGLKLQHEEIRRARHDLRHHLLILQNYIRANDLASLKEYLDDYQKIRTESLLSVCAIPAVNALASHYHSLAQKNKVEISFALDLPEPFPLPEKDFIILLGNLLENAWEACERQTRGKKYIRVSSSFTGASMIFLTVENSYDSPIQMENGAYLSSKRNGGAGIGLASIRNTAERFRGQISITHENGVFRVFVFLNPEK